MFQIIVIQNFFFVVYHNLISLLQTVFHKKMFLVSMFLHN